MNARIGYNFFLGLPCSSCCIIPLLFYFMQEDASISAEPFLNRSKQFLPFWQLSPSFVPCSESWTLRADLESFKRRFNLTSGKILSDYFAG